MSNFGLGFIGLWGCRVAGFRGLGLPCGFLGFSGY